MKFHELINCNGSTHLYRRWFVFPGLVSMVNHCKSLDILHNSILWCCVYIHNVRVPYRFYLVLLPMANNVMHDHNMSKTHAQPYSKWHNSIFPKSNEFHKHFVKKSGMHLDLPEFPHDHRAKYHPNCAIV